ncbi:nuclear transport factor 2 family protein [Microvirga sp. M2]|uniref:nuclear transport factor 2 family protein n=1 Tax=Microvirga sp. M2 TaxID=3073270 RepID=UPI0039C115A3
MTGKYASLFDLLGAVLQDRIRPSSDLMSMFATDAEFEFPFAPNGTPKRVKGRDAIGAHFARLAPILQFGPITLHAVYESGPTVLLECSCEGQGVRTGIPYNQTYLCVVTTEAGQIIRYKDYWNPLVLIAALGGQEALEAAYSG